MFVWTQLKCSDVQERFRWIERERVVSQHGSGDLYLSLALAPSLVDGNV